MNSAKHQTSPTVSVGSLVPTWPLAQRNGAELGSATSHQLTSGTTKQSQRSAQRRMGNQGPAQPQIPNLRLRTGQLTAQQETACPSFLLPIEAAAARGPDLRKTRRRTRSRNQQPDLLVLGVELLGDGRLLVHGCARRIL